MRLKEISEICNVSMSTVSRVLNNKKGINSETRKKVLEVYRRLLSQKRENFSIEADFEISLQNSCKRIIDIVVPNLANQFFAEFIKNIRKVAEADEFEVRFWDTDDSIEKEIEILKNIEGKETSGVILISSSKADRNSFLARELSKFQFPIVLADKTIKNCNLDGIFIDNIRGGELLTQHLLSLGKRNISIVSGAANSDVAEERVMGFYNAADRFNLEYSHENIIYADFYDKKVIEDSLNLLFSRKNFDSIICCNNIIAQCVIKKMLKEGISMEEDIKVVSFDKMDFLENIGIFIDYSAPHMESFATETFNILIKKIESKDNGSINTIKVLPFLFKY